MMTVDIQNLKGKILLSSPSSVNGYLEKAMIFVCRHSEEGAMGLIINRLISNRISQLPIFKQLLINSHDSADPILNANIHIGGDREIETCFILHSNKNLIENTEAIDDNILLTTNEDAVESLNFVINNYPEQTILCFGCQIWEEHQLEKEITANQWIPIPADVALIFGNPYVDKWSKAFLKIGLHSTFFVDRSGKA